MNTTHSTTFRFLVSRALPLLVWAFAAAGAMAQADPPARVGTLTDIQGSVAFAPPGEKEWADAQRNRPVTAGDRLWTDRGSRAELHLGSAVLHIDGQTYLDVTQLDDGAFQASLNEGTVNARVRELESGENFEIDTPQLALRAAQPGDWRIDVDPATGTTSIIVHSGAAVVYGAGGESLQLQAGQQLAFTGRDLQQVAMPPLRDGGFDRYAADRNRAEDQSMAARYVPRDVVGYGELDAYGSWSQDPTYGAVWFPRITVADWAPYRYGHWEWIGPWGWTWIDDAPWGFAPFHYGRWTVINSRWCWVPGRLGPRPVYAPALVAFVGGGGGGFNLTIGSGPGIGWFPLAPGEAWRPTFRASTNYVRNVNRNFRSDDRADYFFHRRPNAVTSVRVEDFTRGRPVHQHWQRASANEITRAPVATTPSLPGALPRHFAETTRPSRTQVQPPALAGVGGNRPQGQFVPPGLTRAPGLARTPPGLERRAEESRVQQERVQREQQIHPSQQQQQAQQQAQQERVQRAQQMQQERAARDQERAQRAQQVQQERAQREQAQAQRQQMLEQQRDRAARQQQAQAAAQERAQLQQQRAAQMQERAQERAQLLQQQRAAQAQARAQQHQQAAQAAAAERAMGAQAAAERRGPPARQERGSDDEGRGRGHGRRDKD